MIYFTCVGGNSGTTRQYRLLLPLACTFGIALFVCLFLIFVILIAIINCLSYKVFSERFVNDKWNVNHIVNFQSIFFSKIKENLRWFLPYSDILFIIILYQALSYIVFCKEIVNYTLFCEERVNYIAYIWIIKPVVNISSEIKKEHFRW